VPIIKLADLLADLDLDEESKEAKPSPKPEPKPRTPKKQTQLKFARREEPDLVSKKRNPLRQCTLNRTYILPESDSD
jgi:hypothetical protein